MVVTPVEAEVTLIPCPVVRPAIDTDIPIPVVIDDATSDSTVPVSMPEAVIFWITVPSAAAEATSTNVPDVEGVPVWFM